MDSMDSWFLLKEKDFKTMQIPTQCCWMIRKIMDARRYLNLESDDAVTHISIRKIYWTMIGERPHVGWNKMLYHNAAPSKFVFISWLLLHRGLATCDYLQKIGIMVDTECCLCGQEDESLEHLFFSCQYSGELWEQLTSWCKVARRRQSWDLEKLYLIQQCRSKSSKQTMYRSVVTVTVYLVWKERNARRMKGEHRRVEDLIQQGKILMAVCGQREKKVGRLLGFI